MVAEPGASAQSTSEAPPPSGRSSGASSFWEGKGKGKRSSPSAAMRTKALTPTRPGPGSVTILMFELVQFFAVAGSAGITSTGETPGA